MTLTPLFTGSRGQQSVGRPSLMTQTNKKKKKRGCCNWNLKNAYALHLFLHGINSLCVLCYLLLLSCEFTVEAPAIQPEEPFSLVCPETWAIAETLGRESEGLTAIVKRSHTQSSQETGKLHVYHEWQPDHVSSVQFPLYIPAIKKS